VSPAYRAGEPRLQVITMSIETPDGRLPLASVQVPEMPMGVAHLVPPMQQLCNGVVGLALRRQAQGRARLSCGKGCGVCCCQLVPLAADVARRVALQPRDASRQRFGSRHHDRLTQGDPQGAFVPEETPRSWKYRFSRTS